MFVVDFGISWVNQSMQCILVKEEFFFEILCKVYLEEFEIFFFLFLENMGRRERKMVVRKFIFNYLSMIYIFDIFFQYLKK